MATKVKMSNGKITKYVDKDSVPNYKMNGWKVVENNYEPQIDPYAFKK